MDPGFLINHPKMLSKNQLKGSLIVLPTPADNTLKQLKSATDRKSVTKVVEMLARPKRDGRGQLLDGLSKLPRTHWPHLVTLMTDAKVAIRAAAATALATATRADLPFDPFADATTRRDQIKAWRTWLTEHPATRPAALTPTY